MGLFVESKKSLNNESLGRERIRAALRFQVAETENAVSRAPPRGRISSTQFLFRRHCPHPLGNESFFGLSWTIDLLYVQERRAPWSTVPSRPNAEGAVPLREMGRILYTEKKGAWRPSKVINSCTVHSSVFFFLFIIQFFLYFYSQ